MISRIVITDDMGKTEAVFWLPISAAETARRLCSIGPDSTQAELEDNVLCLMGSRRDVELFHADFPGIGDNGR